MWFLVSHPRVAVAVFRYWVGLYVPFWWRCFVRWCYPWGSGPGVWYSVPFPVRCWFWRLVNLLFVPR